MDLVLLETVTDDDGRLWELYRRAFGDLLGNAVQEHLMSRADFIAMLADPRVVKYVTTDAERGRYAALAAMTNHLDAVPLISPPYFERQWPEYYVDRRIWYVTFVAVDPDYQGTGAMSANIERMVAEATRAGGMICVDICAYRESGIRLPDAIERIARSHFTGVLRHRMDEQVYWSYEFPTPA